MPEKKCEFCGGKAGKSEFNSTGDLCCQGCFILLCENCAIYGNDILPRCENCHDEHIERCDKCKGNIKNTKCEYCEYC